MVQNVKDSNQTAALLVQLVVMMLLVIVKIPDLFARLVLPVENLT
jgi:hypothetical protein